MTGAATTERETRTLSKQSAHHRHSPATSTRPATFTTARWLNDACASVAEANLRPVEFIECKLYKLVRGEQGEYDCKVAATFAKRRAFATNTATIFHRYDASDGSLLDSFFSGDGEGSKLRDQDAQKLLAAWATTVQPTPEESRNAAKALTIRCAIRRGVALAGWEAS